MQQATKSSDQSKADAHVHPVSVGNQDSTFVINLCSSTSPVALSPPDHAGLKRFTFFVSRRREEGRERFRLHMGYFSSQEEAERLLDIVREIYPGAWAGMAPGQRLRAAAAAAKDTAVGAPIEQEVPPATAVAVNVAASGTAAPATIAAVSVPVSTWSPAVSASPVAAEAAPATSMPIAPIQEISFDLLPNDRRATKPAEPTKPVDASIHRDASMSEEAAAARSLSDVRAAIASLADTSTRAPTLRAIPELKPPANIPVAKAAPLKVMPQPVPKAASDKSSDKPLELVPELSDEAAMAVLESRAQDSESVKLASKGAATASPGNRTNPEKAVYAVQLMWSVQPIDIAQVPQLAIFSAYTLYGAEGNRDGRRWYGLRLGFFTDAVSAKQVAHYVRSEFSTVSVVPVTPRERERAKIALTRPAQPAAPVKSVAAAAPACASVPHAMTGPMTGAVASVAPGKPAAPASAARPAQFEFIEDKPMSPATARDLAAGPRTGRGAPGKRAKLRTPAQSAARNTKPRKLTLEETLEILGAGDLKVDDGRGAFINTETAANAAAPRPQPAKAKPSRLGRLFERLSERIGN